MNSKKIAAVFILLLLLSAQNAFARRAPTQPDSYDGAAPTARSMAMGETGTGLASLNDAYYYNSAMYGFSGGTKAEVSGVVLRRSDASPARVAVIEPSGQGLTSFIMLKDTGGLVWQALSDNSVRTSYADGSWQNTETYINSLSIVAGQKNEKGYSFGINMTYLYGKIGESSLIGGEPHSNIGSGNGMALDLSFAIPAGNNIFFGINLKNIVGFMFWNDYNTEQLPFIVRTGTGYHFKGFLFAADWEKRYYRFGDLQEDYLRFGVEQYINGAVCVRLGLVSDENFNSDTFKYTYGFGFKIKTYELSAAAQQYKIDDGNFTKYMVSLGMQVQ